MINLRKKIIIIICCIFFSLIILELGIRAGGFIFLFLQDYRNQVSIRKNGTYMIMCLGESTTAGQYPGPLEEILNKRNTGVRFSVIDKGIMGANTVEILSQLKQNLDIYKPNMVIVMAGCNDIGISYYKDIPEATTGVFQYCRVYKFMRLIYMHIVKKLKKQDMYGLVRVGPKRSATQEGLRRCDEKTGGSLKKDIILHPQNDNNYLELGLAYQHQNKLTEAEALFKKAIDLNPKNDNAYVGLGLLYGDQGKLTQAEDLFKKAIDLNPKNDNAYVGLGRIYRDKGNPTQTEDLFKKAIELNPKNDNAYAGLGRIYRDQGKLTQTEDLFKKAIDLNPKNDNAYVGLGLLYQDQGKLTQAEDLFKKAIDLNLKNDNTYVGLGWFYQDQGKLTQAEDLFKRTIGLNPKNDNAYGAISVLYEGMGKPELAKEYAEKANELRLEYKPVTVNNYRELKEILDQRGVKLVCVQYPMRNVESLKKIFKKNESVIFVDNETAFKEIVRKLGPKEVFVDMYDGDFGHCTEKGNRLLATNIADVILKEVFHK